MLAEETVRRLIAATLPDADTSSMHFFNEGWDFELWEDADGLLFRFPKRDACVAPLLREARLLSHLTDALATPLPSPVHVHEATSDGNLPFFVYKKLEGVPLSSANRDVTSALTPQVGRFLTELHGVAAEAAASTGVPVHTAQSWRDKYQSFRDEVKVAVYPLLPRSERAAVDDFWRGFLDDDSHFRFRPALVHADLGLEHLLVDERAASLTGVIDFADAMVGDPALDFVVAHTAFGKDLLAAYGVEYDETLFDRARAYWQIGPFYEVLYGQLIGRLEHIDAGLDGIRCRLTERHRSRITEKT